MSITELRSYLLALLTQFQTFPIIDLVELQRIHYNCLSRCLFETRLYMKKAILGLLSNVAFSLLVTSNYNKPTKTFYGGGK